MTIRISQGGMSAQKHKPDIFFPLHILQSSLTYNHRLDSASRRIPSLAGFFVVVVIVTHFCNCSQSTEILNKYFKALYFISFSPNSFCYFYKQKHTSFDLTFTSVKSDNTELGTQVYKTRLILCNLFMCC